MPGLRTLIVDDSAVMRKIVQRALRQAGFAIGEVLEAGNGFEALDVLRHQTVDLVLSDMNMPVMDGLEFMRQLGSVENARGVPVLMITTEGSESHVMEAISCGAAGYIRKPFTPDQMKQHVLPLLEKTVSPGFDRQRSYSVNPSAAGESPLPACMIEVGWLQPLHLLVSRPGPIGLKFRFPPCVTIFECCRSMSAPMSPSARW